MWRSTVDAARAAFDAKRRLWPAPLSVLVMIGFAAIAFGAIDAAVLTAPRPPSGAQAVLLGLLIGLTLGLIPLLWSWRRKRRLRMLLATWRRFGDAPHPDGPPGQAAGRSGDEIDALSVAVERATQRIASLADDNTVLRATLGRRKTGLAQVQRIARVVPWVGQPLAGTLSFGDGAREVNPILAHISRWSQFIAFVHPQDRAMVSKAWRSGRRGSDMDVEFRLRINRTQIDMRAVARFDISGTARVLRATGVIQDISEMRSLQRALRQHRDGLEELVATRTRELAAERNRAKQLAASKGQFLADMSHEIRTPLTSILGLSQIGMQQSQHRSIGQTFEQILAAGDHLLCVVNDVLDYSKLEAGRLSINAEPFELRWVVQRCVDMFRAPAAKKGLVLSVDIADKLPHVIVADRFRVQQILINLLSNALKFTARGEISLAAYQAANQVCFRVRDTGVGMNGDQLRQLFRPFYQHVAGDGEWREGTGLGLTISKRIAGLMDGDIQVRSAPGEGSRFLLHLPLRTLDSERADQPVVPAQAAPGDLDAQLVGLRVLVADDVTVNRQVVEHLLHMQGAEVDVARDGGEAIDAVESGDGYDVVLMDVQMPGIDGREATRRLRAGGHDVPIIGITAHVSDTERQASLDAGMQDQLVKPLLQETLVEKILIWVGRRAADKSADQNTV